jgi:alpha-L-fucosidase
MTAMPKNIARIAIHVTTVRGIPLGCVVSAAVCVAALLSACATSAAAPWDPASSGYSGHRGKTFYVSKRGDNSDGSSWQRAFHSIQAALLAVPDGHGGHRVIVRPDSYVEANLFPAQKGAAGSYNLLVGDSDGSLGSGASGRIVIDASCPGVAVRRNAQLSTFEIVKSDLPESGFKSVDWWAPILSTTIRRQSSTHTEQTFTSLSWDRWILRNVYVTGGDAGLFWDFGWNDGGFTVIVEDCVGIGRAFGGGVCYPNVRRGEPSTFHRCYFLALDWVGDTAAVLVGGSEKAMPEQPHAVFEDCTFVHSDNAVAISYASHCARAKFVDCRMIVLNFTQPDMGGQSTGIICTQGRASTGRLHVDLENCILTGYSVFTPGKDAEAVTFTTRGKVQAYVQFRQPLPAGFVRLGQWPVELFDRMAPPQAGHGAKAAVEGTSQKREQRMAWWREARFGMFIHFGLFSLPTKVPRHMDQYFALPIEEFHSLKDQFNPAYVDVERWVRLAKTAGMKYIVLVTKSHDGWCLFDSRQTDFDVMATPYRRDILKPLAEACRREGLRICWYYSIIDWDHPDYLPRRNLDKRPMSGADMDRYVAYMKLQLRELLTNYGPIGAIWFDGNWDPSWTEDRGMDLEQYLRDIQPDIIVNNRVGKNCPNHISQGHAAGDFDTPEQMVPVAALARADWESCVTMNDHWQFIDYDQNWKSTSALVRMLVDVASKGGNFLLDVGPRPDGSMPQPAVDRLEGIGRWMDIYGESIYGTKAGPFAKPFSWGRCTAKTLADGKTRLYLHVFDWPTDRKLVVPGLSSRVRRAHLLGDVKQTPLDVAGGEGCVTLFVPPKAPDQSNSVVVLEVD